LAALGLSLATAAAAVTGGPAAAQDPSTNLASQAPVIGTDAAGAIDG